MEDKFIMMDKKFKYYLNAVHYCIYLEEKWSMKKVDNSVLWIMHYLSILFSAENFYNKKVGERKKSNELREYMYSKEGGVSISSAHHWFGLFYSGYSSIFSFILLGGYFRFWRNEYPLLSLLIIAIPIGIFYIPAYRAVFSKDRYLKYFKQFEEEDERWLKKWRRRTILFCVGSIAAFLMGILSAWGILSL